MATQEAAKASSGPSIVVFGSPRSGRCRRVDGFIAQVLQRRRNHETFTVRRVDVDEHPHLAERFGIENLPTLVVVEDRRVRARIETPRTVSEVRLLLEPWLN